MTISEWYAQNAGKRLNSRNGILGECVSAVQNYAENVLGVGGSPVFPVPYARLMTGIRSDAFDWIPNTPTGVPQYGDIVVFNGRMGGGAGHTGVAIEGSDTNQVRVIQQNDPTGSGLSIKTYPYTNVSGWLHPKSNAGTPAQGGEMIIGSGENWYGRLNKLHQQVRGRDLGRDVFNSFVGQDTLKFIEAVSDDPEADAVQHAQEVGTVAVRDKWDQQIYTLQKQFTDATKLANDLQARLVASENSTKALTDKVDKLNAKVAEMEKNKSDDTILLNESGSWITKLLTRLGVKK